jgi:imidazoleglycerol-phosphate dehydratase
LFARHGGFDRHFRPGADVDQHHTVEDIGIALGEACSQASGRRDQPEVLIMPMDETLGVAAVDQEAGRIRSLTSSCASQVGDLRSAPACFFGGFARGARERAPESALWAFEPSPVEALFKGFARAARLLA